MTSVLDHRQLIIVQGERRKLRALGDITNLVTTRTAIKKPTKKASKSLSSVLGARSKVASGIATTKLKDPVIINIDDFDKNNELAVVEYVEDIYMFYKLSETQGFEGKNSWDELVGTPGQAASDIIERQNERVYAVIVPEGSFVTTDIQCDRVRVFVNKNNIVTRDANSVRAIIFVFPLFELSWHVLTGSDECSMLALKYARCGVLPKACYDN
ncbi:G2/mitotic-specific cyclin S13-7-like protein [Tanacetum coccineum]|uniref:G2/mitotic-specific cyclin S13-7-like protein n=1 Tax=Tanacetum coccineum TaxID=301880 RepID=A0ABQ5I0R4_9ASTR